MMDGLELDFEWDAVKAASNVLKHGLGFELAASVMFDALALTVFDDAHSQYEERWFTLGVSSNGQLLAVSHTFVTTGARSAITERYNFSARAKNPSSHPVMQCPPSILAACVPPC